MTWQVEAVSRVLKEGLAETHRAMVLSLLLDVHDADDAPLTLVSVAVLQVSCTRIQS
jgi:hypothetical protein